MTEARTDRPYPPFDDDELSEGAKFLRRSRTYADLMPPPKTIKWDWFLFDAIGQEIARRRTPDSELALLVGSVVREFIPDTSSERRRLGMAYRDAYMFLFRRRKNFVGKRRKKKGVPERPEIDGQPRLI